MANRKPAPKGAKCCEYVLYGTRPYPCGAKAKVAEDGRHFCGRHDPKKARDRCARRNVKFEAERAASYRARSIANAREAVLAAAVSWSETRDDAALLDAVAKLVEVARG